MPILSLLILILNSYGNSPSNKVATITDEAVVVRKGGKGGLIEIGFYRMPPATFTKLTGRETEGISPLKDERSIDKLLEDDRSLEKFFQRAGIPFDIEGAGLSYSGSQIVVSQTPINHDKILNLLRKYNEVKSSASEDKITDLLLRYEKVTLGITQKQLRDIMGQPVDVRKFSEPKLKNGTLQLIRSTWWYVAQRLQEHGSQNDQDWKYIRFSIDKSGIVYSKTKDNF